MCYLVGELLDDRFVLGSPAEVCEQLLDLHKTMGVNHIIASVQGAGMPQSQYWRSFIC
ncbi:MAG: hypothetical protein VX941_04025 [Pseudomonadota bacterium]|nr:hypothetical protein [Pseudomonadota bacterium]